jgi:2-(1,2-epoxy-1,2-dihydrophenyl)acetyl-CoA isomerase
MSDTVLLDVTGAVATITLNRPDGMNSLTVEAKVALNKAVAAVASDDRVRALVLTGSGRAFCVGQDLKEHAALIEAGDPAPLSTVTEHYNPLVTRLAELPFPTIAAINGTAAGAGLGIAAALDYRIGAAGARYTTAFAGIGLTADSGLSWSLPRLIGAGRAAELLLLAQPFTSERALELGFLNELVDADQVLARATERAGQLAKGPTAAYACIKESLAFGSTHSFVETLAKEDELQTRAGDTSDHANAVRSFLAKQPPVFEGR